MQQRPAVAHAALVVAGVPQQLVVGGQDPGERQEGAQGGDAYRGRAEVADDAVASKHLFVCVWVCVCVTQSEQSRRRVLWCVKQKSTQIDYESAGGGGL